MDWTWSFDQALIWVTTRNIETIKDENSRWAIFNVYLGEEAEGEWNQRNMIAPPEEAYRQLIESIRSEGVKAFAGGKRLEAAWFVGTRLQYDSDDRALLVHDHGGDPHRVSPTFVPENVIKHFPVDPMQSISERDAAQSSKKPLAGLRLSVVEAAKELWGGPPPQTLQPKVAANEISKYLRAKGQKVPNDVRRMLRHLKENRWKSET